MDFLKKTLNSRIMVESRWLMWAFGKWTVFAPSNKYSTKKAEVVCMEDDFDTALERLKDPRETNG